MEIKARNTNELMIAVISSIQQHGIREDSRNGPVLRFPEPVTICLTHPWERVNFSHVRDGNPFFHLMESLSMLGAFNNAPFLAHFAKRMLTFSDDGQKFNAFYGTRLRRYHTKAFPYPSDAVRMPQDQLAEVIEVLKADPLSRQAVCLLWDPADLSYHKTKDKACNLLLVFSNDRGKLRMSSYNRSNDAIWGGVMGANIVHLSFFQEYVACALGWPQGEWWHHSNNLHVYEAFKAGDKLEPNKQWSNLAGENDVMDAYPRIDAKEIVPLFLHEMDRSQFEQDLRGFLLNAFEAIQPKSERNLLFRASYNSPFISEVAVPMFNAWQLHRVGLDKTVDDMLATVKALDWRLACSEWIQRRRDRRKPEVAS